ncbi:DinB family protein [Novipirellula caenicola]|uniref:DinB-like domain-containing protein n=1 Tax=Novipirellula caenicola TaxID=1536901 RepID=A0ABP9VV69_9BACT
MNDFLKTIDQYANGPDRLELAVSGTTHKHQHAKPGPGDWSIHEVVIHLADSDAVSIERMKRIVAMEEPSLLNFDETAFIRDLKPELQSIEDAMLLFRINRRQWSRVLRQLPTLAFDRVGHHSVAGPVSLRQMVSLYIEHLEGHLCFIRHKRERLNCPLSPEPSPTMRLQK